MAQRLPSNIVPSHYELRFVPDLAAEKFSGQETIEVTVKEPTTTVVLNSTEIEIDEVTITSGGRTQTAAVALDPARETAMFVVANRIEAGPASIAVRFRGTLNDKLRGFYISRSARRKYAVTQFEPTDARRAFPSFDEPAMKATYALTLVLDEGDSGISNARVVSDVPGPGPGKHTVTFDRTAKMSTYLVAILVGDWQCSEGGVDGIPIRVCATPENKELTKWGLTTAEAELRYFHEYYAFKYPFGKLDIITFPDFEAGAMENAGAITFRETALLVDEKRASATQLRNVASTNSHEIAHMWFGDVVTMQWWDDIWLNEGFATWISSKPLEAWKPEWNVRVDDAAETSYSLGVDSLESTRPIRNKAETPAEINQMFDGIAYGKTAAVLRMLESYVGETAFRDGIRAYIGKYAYANAKAEDFWSTMAATTKQPIDRIMPSFVMQAGAPLVSASARCEGDATLITLAQRRMFARRRAFVAGSGQLWTIPVTVRDLDHREAAPRKFLLSKKKEVFRVKGCSPHLFINHDARGFYRTVHAPGMIPPKDLVAMLSPSERVALVNDTWALVRIGEADVAATLTLVDRLRSDRERAVVSDIIEQLITIGVELVPEQQAPAFRRWVAGYLRPIADEVGWTGAPGEPDEQKRLRAKVIHALGFVARDEETLRRARELTDQAMKDPDAVEGTLLETVVALAAQSGDAGLFDRMEKAMLQASSPQERYRYLHALAFFEDPALQKRALALTLSPEVRNQDLPGYFRTAFDNPTLRTAAWEFLKANWTELRKKFTPWGGATIVGSTRNLCDPKQREDVQRFFAAHPIEAADRSIAEALERIDMCVELQTLQTRNVASWLTSQPQAPAGGQ